MHTGLAATRQRRAYRGLTLRAGAVAAAGPFAWGVAFRPGWGVMAYWVFRSGGVSARRHFGPVGVLFGVLARAGNAAPHKKALVLFIYAGKFLADGGRLALFGGHITHNARAGVCFAALRE